METVKTTRQPRKDYRRHEPEQNPGQSKQDYETPWELVRAVEGLLGQTFDVDLAARADNAKAPRFITPEENTFTVNWSTAFAGCLAWLNPEFGDIAPYAERCSLHGGVNDLQIVMLTPASIGSNWYAEHVHEKASIVGLRPRITFVGAPDPYPKDLMLSLFGFGQTGIDVWKWKQLQKRTKKQKEGRRK